ncbi:hypothetical protein BYT27DRAFT_7337669 [Phlegmacium glaucopus]|nr:hypothetical protein BYT27DRAFT_7337669 [Phlegmacium glaucopus]
MLGPAGTGYSGSQWLSGPTLRALYKSAFLVYHLVIVQFPLPTTSEDMKRRQHSTQVSYPTYPGVILEMGIALYERDQGRGYPTWALVFHPESLLAHNVRIYRISNDSENWFLDFKTCALTDLGVLILVLKVSSGIRVPSMQVLDIYMSKFPPGRDSTDASRESLWSGSSWVLRALERFDTVVTLPCRTSGRLSDYIRQRIIALGATRARPGKPRIIPLAGTDDTMPLSSTSKAPLPVLQALCAIAKQLRESEGKPPMRKTIMPIDSSRHYGQTNVPLNI